MYYVVSVKHDPKIVFVTEAVCSVDALVKAYRDWVTAPDYEDAYEEAGSANALADQLQAEYYDCVETYRAMVLEYVERRMDGDRNITIVL